MLTNCSMGTNYKYLQRVFVCSIKYPTMHRTIMPYENKAAWETMRLCGNEQVYMSPNMWWIHTEAPASGLFTKQYCTHFQQAFIWL